MSCSNIATKLEAILNCCICQEIVTKPQTFNCFHSFCIKCVAQLPRNKVGNQDNGESRIRCPVCNSFSREQSLQSSYLVNELLEMHGKLKSDNNICEQCSKHESKWKCIDCKMGLCDECQVNHVKIPICRNHRIIERGRDEEMVVDALVFCKIHPDEPVKFNCQDCEVPMCIKCKVTKHENHRTETIEETLQRLLPEVKANAAKLQEKIATFTDDHQTLTDEIKKVKESFTICRDRVRNNLNEGIEILRKQHDQMIKQLDMKEEEVVTTLEVTQSELETKKNEFSQVCDWVGTSIEAARGVSLMAEMQAGLYSKVLNLTKLEPSKPPMVQVPELTDNKAELEFKNMMEYNFI